MKKLKNVFINLFIITILGLVFYFSYLKSQEKNINIRTLSFESSVKDASIFNKTNGQLSFVYLGFLSCPEICPTTLSKMSRVYKKLSTNEQEKIDIFFITLDPERDSLEAMKIYTNFFNEKIIVLKLDIKNLNQLTTYLGIYFKKVFLFIFWC